MPIYSDDEAEVEDRLASLLAGAGATTSLAASAAAVLKLRPDSDLPPRLRAALQSTVDVVERSASLDIYEDRMGARPFPEELVARLAERSQAGEPPSNAREVINAILADLRSLLNHPSSEVAGRIEEFLAALSQSENATAQSLARGTLDLEFLGFAAVAR